MHFSISSALTAVVVLASSVQATKFMKPSKMSSWKAGEPGQIQWDSSGMKGPVSMHLCQGGATDISAIIITVAVSIENSGSYMWSAPKSLPHHDSYSLAMVDHSTSIIIFSEIFIIIDLDDSTGKGSSQYTTDSQNRYTAKWNRTTTVVSSMASHETSTAEEAMYTTTAMANGETTFIQSTILVTSHSTITVQPIGTGGAATYTSVTPPYGSSNNGSYISATGNAQASGIQSGQPATFTGAASSLSGVSAYSAAVGGFLGALAILL